MMLRPEIQVSHTFPDDAIEDDDDIVQWPGCNVAEAIKLALELRGYRVSDPIHMEFLGWELDIWRGRKRVWLRITLGDEEVNYLVAANMTSWIWPDRALFRAFLSDLQDSLQADQRFSRIGWFPKGGAGTNVAPAAGPFDP